MPGSTEEKESRSKLKSGCVGAGLMGDLILSTMVSWILDLFGKEPIITSLDDTDVGVWLYGILTATALRKRAYRHSPR